jgi:hypothetical protein
LAFFRPLRAAYRQARFDGVVVVILAIVIVTESRL